jgi:hypothetical protein
VQSKIIFATIVTIAVVLAIAGWLNKGNLTSVLNVTVALPNTWYVLPEFQEKGAVQAAKHPTTITTFITITAFVLPAVARRN